MSSSPPFGTDLILGIAGIGTAVVAVGLFLRATRFKKPVIQVAEEVKEPAGAGVSSVEKKSGEGIVSVEQAERSLKLLALEKDALSLVMGKFFEAEDDGDISQEDRLRLSSEYESKLKTLEDRIKHTELVVYLNKLEKMREEIVKLFNTRLGETDAEIKKLRGELRIEEPVEVAKKLVKEKKPEEPKEEEEGEEEEKSKPKRQRVSEIDEKIEKLRQEVLKELEELEKLEIEI